jgi:acetoin utilization protein AcuB
MLVRSRMTPDVYTVSPDTTIAEALNVTRSHRIRHLPVLSEGRLVGLVTDRDLRLAMPPIWADQRDELKSALHTRTVGEVMVQDKDIITAPPVTPVEEAAKLLYENRIGCLPIMDGAELVGILTETDLLRALVELFGTHQPSSRVEVRMPNKPGELARVVRLVGIEHKINITGLVVPPSDDRSESLAIMHLQTLNPRPVVDALRKLGYAVGWPALDLDAEDALADSSSHGPREHVGAAEL